MKINVYVGPTDKYRSYLLNKGFNKNEYYSLLGLAFDAEKNKYPVSYTFKFDMLVVFSSDYSSVTESVLYDFVEFIKFANINTVYIQNPPRHILEEIKLHYSQNEISLIKHNYKKINSETIKKFKEIAPNKIIGQDVALKSFTKFLLINNKLNRSRKPIVILMYGPSGVGKTDTCRVLAQIMKENLFIKQFSMFQSNQYADYLFGGKIQDRSLARDLMERQSNILVFDEFDKCNSIMYSAFYELFDTGIFKDKNYEVDLKNTLIICTSNFHSQKEVYDSLGEPMYFRINGFIKYDSLTVKTATAIVNKFYGEYLSQLNSSECRILDEFNVKEKLLSNINKFSNARQIENSVRNLIADVLE